jgi:hypothetical protein
MKKTQSYQTQSQNLSASVKASIFANLTGPDRGVLVLGILFLIVFLSSLSFLSISNNMLACIGVYVGLGGLVILLIYWLIISRSYHFDTPLSSISIRNDTISIETPVRDTKNLILLMREAIQNRKPLPPPEGKILDGLPSVADSIKKYSEEEKNLVHQEMRTTHEKQEQEFLLKIEDIQKKILKIELTGGDAEQIVQRQDDIPK